MLNIIFKDFNMGFNGLIGKSIDWFGSLFVGGALLAMSILCHAESKAIQDIDYRYTYYHVDYKANDNYTQEQTVNWAVKVLNDRAIKNLKSTSVSYSVSVEKIEVLAAYTIKADGRKIEAPKNNYQVQSNSGMNDKSPLFSDRTRITIVFPDVAVGDTLFFNYKRTVSEPMFPNYFAEGESFSKSVAYDDVKISMDVPKAFSGIYKVRAMSEKVVRKGSRVNYQWAWKNKVPTSDSRKDYSVWNMEANPGFSYTTFSSYKSIAEAYGVRAIPKAVVSDDVKSLAQKIVGVTTDKKEQARLIYEWVATNISYAGNCVGVGAVVPHDVAFILDNRMGDCKDHATLLQALLASQNIKSIQALINSGNVFELPSVPAVNSVNHVINYLPEFKLFVDSTSDSTPFGFLPKSIQGKPVLLSEDYIDGLKTPTEIIGSNKQVSSSIINFQEDGSSKGNISVSLFGEPAISTRPGWRKTSIEAEENWLKDLFNSNGGSGHATIKKDDPKPLLDTFNYSMDFEQQEAIMTDSAGAVAIYPPVPSYYSIANLTYVAGELEEHDVACASSSSLENYTYSFPKNFKVLDVPKNLDVEGAFISYHATYQLDGNLLKVTRTFDDKTPGPVCSFDLIRKQREILQKINRNLKGQIIYKPLLDE